MMEWLYIVLYTLFIFVHLCSDIIDYHKSVSYCFALENIGGVFMLKNIVDEMFILHHLDLGLDEEEIEDILEGSTWEQKEKWLKRNGYSLEEQEG